MSSKLHTQATRALISHAIFRSESAFTIALTILLVALFPHPFPWWPGWAWVVLGLVAEGLIIATSLTDPKTGQQVVADMLRQQFNPRSLRTPQAREWVERALEYREKVEEAIRQQHEGVLKAHLQDTAPRIDDWLAHIFNLAQRLDRYAQDPIVARDSRDLPRELAQMRERLEREDDSSVREQVQEAIRQKGAQQANLKQLENTMERAEFRLKETLAALGTLYSQVLLLDAGAADSGRMQRLQEDIAQQVAALQDTNKAMDEVYQSER